MNLPSEKSGPAKVKSLVTILICIFCLSLFSQDKKTDSLKLFLTKSKADTNRLNTLLNLEEIYSVEGSDSTLVYHQKALSLISQLSNDRRLRKKVLLSKASAISLLADYYDTKSDFEQAMNYYRCSYLLFDSLGNYSQAAYAQNNMGFTCQHFGKMDDALIYYDSARVIYERIQDTSGLSLIYNNIGYINKTRGDLKGALDHYYQSLHYRELLNNNHGVIESLVNIGAVLDLENEKREALKYYSRAYQLSKKTADVRYEGVTLQGLAKIHGDLGDSLLQLQYLNEALSAFTSIQDKRGVASIYNNFGNYYKTRNTETALMYFRKSVSLKRIISDKKGLAVSLNNIAGVFSDFGRSDSVLRYAQESMKFSKEIGYMEGISNAAFTLYNVHKTAGHAVEALEMHELYMKARDSVNSLNNKTAMVRQGFKYDYEKKEAVLKAEQGKLNAEHESERQRQQLVILFVGIVLAVVFVFSILLFRRFRITDKQKKIIEQQKHEVDEAYKQLHEKNKEVMDSIRYAKRIQRSLLPQEKTMEKRLRELQKK